MALPRAHAVATALEASLPPALALAVTPLGLQLERRVEGARRRGGTPAPLRVDFTAPALLTRYASMARAGDALLDACLGPLLRRHGQRQQPQQQPTDDGDAAFTLLDATAGLGRDGAALAYAAHARRLPLRVVLCEAHPVVAALLEDGLRRGAAAGVPWLQPDRVALLHADAADVLRALVVAGGDSSGGTARGERASGADAASVAATLLRRPPHVVYVDPMFTEALPPPPAAAAERAGDMLAGGSSAGGSSDLRRDLHEDAAASPGAAGATRRRSAAPQRELQYLAELVGPAAPAATERLLGAALAAATDRVVVKRHHGAPAVGTVTPATGATAAGSPPPTALPRPAFALPSGKAVRYDVYAARRVGGGVRGAAAAAR